MVRPAALLFTVTVALLAAGCTEGTKPTPLERVQPLFKRLGGEPGIAKLVDDLVATVAADERIPDAHRKPFREGDAAGLKKKLVAQLAEVTGGPHRYTGKSMKEAHAGLRITNQDFDAFVGDLAQALENNKVGKAEQDELLKRLNGMRGDVVEKAE
jgi:hemoglobin